MNWSSVNQYKKPIIIGTFLGCLIGVPAMLYTAITPIPKDAPTNTNSTQSTSPPVNTNAAPEVDLRIKGNKNSRIYHLKGCPNYNDIKESNIIWFKTKEEAENAHFRMARNC